MKFGLASVVRCEEKAMNYGFSNEEAIKLIAEAGFSKVFMSFQNEHLNGGGGTTSISNLLENMG